MSIRAAISAFAYRGARRGTAVTFLVYSGVLTVVLLALAAWIVPEARRADVLLIQSWTESGAYRPHVDPSLWTTLALADVFACWVLALAGFVLAPAAVAAAVAGERRAGTLDQLRTTPLSALGLACGFVVGVPVRLYLLCVGPLAIHVAAGVIGPLPLGTLVQSLAVLAVGTAAACVLALCVALAPRQETGGAFAALGVAALLGVGGLTAASIAGDRHAVVWSYLHPAGAFEAVMLAPDGLWRRMVFGPWSGPFDEASYVAHLGLVPLLSVAASLAFGAMLLGAACRKLAAPEVPLFGKRQAVALFVMAAAALLGPLVGRDELFDFNLSAAYAFSITLLPVVVVVGLFASPTFEAWAMALRRGQRQRWSADDAAPHRAVWLMVALWAVAAGVLAGRHTLVHALDGDEALALGWSLLVALTLPVYFLFASTRYSGLAARWAFGVAVAAHLLCQMIGIGVVRDHDWGGVAGTFATLAAIAAVAVPAWVAWRQRVLARSLSPAR